MGGFRRLARAALAAARGGEAGVARPVSSWRASASASASLASRTDDARACLDVGVAPPGGRRGFASGGAPIVPPGWGGDGGEDAVDPDGSTRRALEVAIDRTGLFRAIEEAHGSRDDPTANLTGLEAHLASIIKFRGGPITVAEYMQEVLTHPEFGYYMSRDVFGVGGDFVTSPEVSQVFGELVGAWAAWQWTQMGKPANVHLVELGPGRGTLMADLLRGTAVFKDFTDAVSVHMVEVSPKLREMQREKLRCDAARGRPDGDEPAGENTDAKAAYDIGDGARVLADIRIPKNPLARGAEDATANDASNSNSDSVGGSTPEDLGWAPVDRGVSGLNGRPVEWHETLDAVPPGPTILIAHEFFDAMPAHQFTRTERGWCERLVALRGAATEGAGAKERDDGEAAADASSSSDATSSSDASSSPALELVLSPGLTPAGALMIPRRLEGMPKERKEGLRQLEISPRTLAVWERVAARLEAHGGAALAIDYGEEGPIGDSLQAIKNHEFVDVLRDPGSADLSIYVDFGAMRQVIENRDAAGGGVKCYGPVTQRDLLFGLGIQERLEKLVEECETEEQAERVYRACERLVGGDSGTEGGDPGMGFRYKALAMVSRGMGVPAGFESHGRDGSETR